MRVTEIFREGGFTMYWILLLGLGGLALAVVHAAMPRKWSLITAVVMFAFVAGIAILGMRDGRRKVENGAVGLDREPELKERMLAQGYLEAMRPVQFAGVLTALGGVLVGAGEVRRRKAAAATP
jgi:hypothetical protein